jgi:hypothetical protein
MEMFLMIVALSMFGLAVSAMAFGAAVRGELPQPAEKPIEAGVPAPQFFVDIPVTAQARIRTPVPVEALLLQIERHVRLEQAAAEFFQYAPTPEALHMQTMSPLVH